MSGSSQRYLLAVPTAFLRLFERHLRGKPKVWIPTILPHAIAKGLGLSGDKTHRQPSQVDASAIDLLNPWYEFLGRGNPLGSQIEYKPRILDAQVVFLRCLQYL